MSRCKNWEKKKLEEISKRIILFHSDDMEELEKLKKELRELKERHQSLLKDYKELFEEKRKLEEKIEILKYALRR